MALLYRIDASDSSTMFTDAAKTTPVTDGASVYVWSPKSGTITTDGIQATSANRPVYNANYASSGYPGVKFDGTNDCLTIAHSSDWNVTSIWEIIATVYLVSASGGTYRPIISKASNSSWNDTFHLTQSTANVTFGSPQYFQIGQPEVLGQWILLYGRAGTSGNVFFRSTSAGQTEFVPRCTFHSATTPTTNSSDVKLGNQQTYYYNGVIGEIRVYSGGESKSTIDAAVYDMSTRWGLLPTYGGVAMARGMHGGMRS